MKTSIPRLLTFDFSRKPYQAEVSGGSMTFAVTIQDATTAELQALMAGAFSLDTSVIERDASVSAPNTVESRLSDIWNLVFAMRFAALHSQGHTVASSAADARGSASAAIVELRKSGGAP